MNVAIIDYGAGNVQSVRGALEAAGAEVTVACDPEAVLAADRLVLPGVGAAGAAAERLAASGLGQALNEAVRQRGRPMLGICLGMQLLGEKLFEFGEYHGLGWIAGKVVHLRETCSESSRFPHMGWNSVVPEGAASRFFEAPERLRTFYFCHSYTLIAPTADVVAARVSYGTSLVAAVLDQTVLATQFHPEKSQINGQRLLKSFLSWSP